MIALKDWKPEDVLTAIALIGATFAFIVGLMQYRRAQQWKRAEWVAQEMKLLFGDPLVQAALLMIDWGSRYIPLYPERENPSERAVLLTNEIVARALMQHQDRPEGFSVLEADIRAAFDRALDGVERFASYEETGLVTLTDLQPYLKYWAVNLCRERSVGPSEERLIRLKEYMDSYGFDGAHKLLQDIAALNFAKEADVAANRDARPSSSQTISSPTNSYPDRKMSRICGALSPAEAEFIRSEFAGLRSEIDRRSSEQFLYLSLSITAAGALAAIALGNAGGAERERILMIVPFLCSILGFLWLDHDRTILAIGSYIGEQLWPSDLPSFEREKPRYRGKPSRFLLGFLTPTMLAFLAPASFSLARTSSFYKEPLWIGGLGFLVVYVFAALWGVWSRHLAR